MQPVLRPIRHSAARFMPAGPSVGEAQQLPFDNFYTPQPPSDHFYTSMMMAQPIPQNQQVMLAQLMPHNQQVMSGPFLMVVPAAQLPEGPSMLASGTALPVMPWAEQWNMPQMQHFDADPESCRPPVVVGLDVLQSTSIWPGSIACENVEVAHDARSTKGSGRRQRRKHRRSPMAGACDAALEDELLEMRAAVGNMLQVQEYDPGMQPVVLNLRAAVLDTISSQDAIALDIEAGDRLVGRHMQADCHSSIGSAYGSADVENCAIDKVQSDTAIARLSSGIPEEQQDVFAWINSSSDSMWNMTHSRHGCRIVQKALDVLGVAEKVALVNGLRGHVQEALECPHANHVLQKCVETLAPDHIRFVIEEMEGLGAFFARRRFGCRVVERLLEHCPSSDVSVLTEDILQDAEKLCRHPYGNFVMQHLLEHGTEEQKHSLAEILRANIICLARHRNASHVVESAFVHCTAEDKQQLSRAMESELSDLSRTRCGSFVVREMLGNLPVLPE